MHGNKIKGQYFEEECSHVEADALTPHQVSVLILEDDWQEVCVWLPDTDVFMLLLHLVSCSRLKAQTCLKFLPGKGTKYQEIDVVE